jgi:hypothetical protein
MSRIEGRSTSRWLLCLAVCAALAACEGDDGERGPPGPPAPPGPTSTTLTQGDDPPGIHIAILGLSGGSGAGGNFRPGDRIRVNFTITKDDGSDWDITEMSRGRILVSGPSFNYNRVIPELDDLHTASVRNADGSYTYTFPTVIPATYAAPYNDTPAFGALEGELTGQALLDGTYTLGLYTRWDYTVDGESARDADNATVDFLMGGAQVLTPRAVVSQENCDRCHADLQAHGGMRKDVTLCLMCHTSGSEDDNAGGATPGVSVDFRVMIHKIHNARHLPSVLGVATNPDGTRNYAATPAPYVVSGDDFSGIGFPVFPNLSIPMPRDVGYSALTAPERALEDAIRTGVTDCSVCHGDPDAGGPASAPAQGDLAYSQPTRRACGACHDDIDWTLPYEANTSTMPPQNDDASCKLCHDPSGTSLAVIDGHLHPLLDPLVNPGLVFDVTGLDDGSGGAIDPGDKVSVTMSLQDDSGADFDPAGLSSASVVLSGPTSNHNLLLSGSLPKEGLTGAQPFSFNVPEALYYEYVGDSDNGTGGEVFTTSRAPHWAGPTSATTVYSRAPVAGGTTLAADASAFENFIDVASSAGFAVDDVIVIDDAFSAQEEYLRVQWIDGNRLWFASPAQSGYQFALRMDHAAGATVRVAALTTLTEGVDYTLDANAGTITEAAELGDVAVVVSYTSDFVMPAAYGPSLNDSPDLGEESGEWTGKSIVDGTYSLNVWGSRSLSVNVSGEVTSYSGTSPSEQEDFLVGSATTLEPYDLISDAADCYACHQDLWFHGGGRRGFETCLACHGTAGGEDRPQYRAWGAPPTTGVQIGFREMLHKIHMGEELANASSYTLVGFGSGGPPNNFSTHTYEEVVFPQLPDGVQNCDACHGASTSWTSPSNRDHPTEQGLPVRAWSTVCNSCHDSSAATAHINSQIVLGSEACAVCHDVGSEWGVEKMHKAY